MKSLENCENCFGSLSMDIQKRIKKFLDKPNFKTWDDIHSIIVAMPFITIWNAMNELDPTFPKTGRVENEKGRVIKEWERIPTPLEVLQAIKLVTDNRR